MRTKASLVMLALICSNLFGCSGHVGYRCEGQPKSDFLQKFGPPARVVKSIENVETWEYRMGSGIKNYTFQDDKCIRQGVGSF